MADPAVAASPSSDFWFGDGYADLLSWLHSGILGLNVYDNTVGAVTAMGVFASPTARYQLRWPGLY
jgi:hypothetical protein